MKGRKNKVNLRRKNKYKNKNVFLLGLIIAAISCILAVFFSSAAVHNVNTNIKNNDQTAKALLIREISNPTYTSAPALGSNNAKVTLVEFGDYQYHFCAAFQRH